VLVLIGQSAHEEPLPRDAEPMQPHTGVEDPPCGGVRDALAFWVWNRRPVLLERAADAGLSGGIDQHTDGHHHPQGHDACGLCERA
jgi:hypothetical protein